MFLTGFYILVYLQVIIGLAPHEITFFIISQKDPHNLLAAENLEKEIIQQSRKLRTPKVYLTHKTFKNVGSWSITSVLLAENLDNFLTNHTKWLILCEDHSIVNLTILIKQLEQINNTKEVFLGYPLKDKEATIIHHFAFFDNPTWFQYPLFRAGVAISRPLVQRLSARIKNEKFTTDFFIDSSHELSLFTWNNGRGHQLTAASFFCTDKQINCAIYNKPYELCNTPVNINKIFFAVKTCKNFHKERIPIIKKTWAEHTKHIRYYSDVEDLTIPTISVNVKNTETGHCEKVLAIFKLITQEIFSSIDLTRNIEWIVLADDDTLLSVPELSNFLGNFQLSYNIYLGERYGYRLHSYDGFNYITGGGGIVFGLNVIKLLAETCICPSISSPDDMIIGFCLQNLGIEPIHSSKFHQARPEDYPLEYLEKESVISFHKFWQIDPIDVFNKWLNSAKKGANKKTEVGISSKVCIKSITSNNCDNQHNENTKSDPDKLSKISSKNSIRIDL